MYKEINQRMTSVDASEKFPDSYIIMRMDGFESDIGTVLFTGKNKNELRAILRGLENQMFCGIIEGVNFGRNCIGGVVVAHG